MIDDKFSICIQLCDSNGKKIHEIWSGEDNYDFLRNKINQFIEENNDIDGGWEKS